MYRKLFTLLLVIFLSYCIAYGCLITNCPRGGKKRNGKEVPSNTNIQDVPLCPSCGPGMTGQCFGPNICCGKFGCLIGTRESLKCKYDGLFDEPEPCIAGNTSCNSRNGRCAAQGICCNQDSCFIDKLCSINDELFQKVIQNKIPDDFYSFFLKSLEN